MNPLQQDPLLLGLVLGALALLPLTVMMTTSFLKISMVLVLVRNAIGVQQAPSSMALNGIALAMTLFVMTPTVNAGLAAYRNTAQANGGELQLPALIAAAEPLRGFMLRNGSAEQRRLFVAATRSSWPQGDASSVGEQDWSIVVPAFVVSEMLKGFEIGFLLYIPFIVIDLLVSNVLLALGMQMVSPATLSLPLKILLFVAADGWGRLLHALVLSYRN